MPGAYPLFVRLLLASGVLLLLVELGEPWRGHMDATGAAFSLAARNHLDFGLGGTRLAVSFTPAAVSADALEPYTRHPPLVPLLLAGAFAVAGESEAVARLVAVLATVASAGFVAALAGLSPWGGGRAESAALFLLLPLVAFFGRLPGHEAITLVFVLMALTGYARWAVRGGVRWIALTLAAAAAAMLSDWPGYYLALVIPLWHLAARPRAGRWPWALPPLAIGLAVLHLAHALALDPRALDGLLAAGRGWSGLPQGASAPATGVEAPVAGAAIRRLLLLLPPVTLALAAWGALRSWRGVGLRGDAVRDGVAWLPWAVLAPGVVHVALFPRAVPVHGFWLLYLAPGMALFAASALAWVRARSAWAAVAALAGAATLGVWGTLRLHAMDDPQGYLVGRALAEATPADAVVAAAPGVRVNASTGYYGRRRIVPAAVAEDSASFRLEPGNGTPPATATVVWTGQGVRLVRLP